MGRKMSEQSYPSVNLASIRGELRVLKISVSLMVAFAALNYLSLFRLVGVSGLPELQLFLSRVMDMIIIVAFLAFCGARVKLRSIDLVLIIFTSYPLLIGLARENFSITFIHDFAIYFSFISKVIIFRTILSRISRNVDLDAIFQKSARKIVFWLGLIAIFSIFTATIMLGRGTNFYYQAPAELTFAAALLLAQGKIFGYLFFFALAMVAGKRMIMVGLLVMALIAALNHAKFRSSLIRFAASFVLLGPLVFIIGGSMLGAELVFVDKILGTFRQVSRALENSDSFLEMLMLLDPGRFVEYVSLQPHLTGWSLWFGNGYGFRYDLNSAFLLEFGYAAEADVTNAHFTPLAIAAKFGLLGVLIWLVLIVTVIKSRFDRRSYVQYACRLAFLSMVVQSFFAYGFFINFFTPFYIAIATIGVRREVHYRETLASAK